MPIALLPRMAYMCSTYLCILYNVAHMQCGHLQGNNTHPGQFLLHIIWFSSEASIIKTPLGPQ